MLDQEKRFLNIFSKGIRRRGTLWGATQDNHFYTSGYKSLFIRVQPKTFDTRSNFFVDYGTLCGMKLFRPAIDRQLFALSLILFIIIGLTQMAAGMFDWYYIFPRLDIPMHIFGGMLIGFFILAVLNQETSPVTKLIWVFAGSIAAGIIIELLEWVIDATARPDLLFQQGLIDTYTDILHDWIGGMLAYCFAYFMKRI